jgi:hypothetical protein
MKVAILIVGQARFFRNNCDILKIKEKYDADVYIHTWKRDDNIFIGSFFHNKIPPFQITPLDIQDYLEKYKVKNFLVEKELSSEYIDSKLKRDFYFKTSNKQTKYNFFSYLYSLNRIIGLVDRISDYDYFIITRSDMDNIILPDLNYLDRNLMITGPISNNPRMNDIPHLTVDLCLCVIPSKNIQIYCNLINKLDEYYDKGYHYAWEEMFFAHIKETNLLKESIQLKIGDIYFELKRNEDGTIKHKLF